MAFKDILVYADTGSAAVARLDTAARLALTHGAHLTALHVSPPPFVPADVMGTGVGADLAQWQYEQRDQRIQAVKAMVEAARQRHGLAIEDRYIDGDIDSGLLDQGRYSDLIVVSQPAAPADLSQPLQPSPGNLVVSAGRPVLVLPASSTLPTLGENVLVAWKSCAEATRAVHDALPLLAKAKRVTVLAANTDISEQPRVAGADIALHLARHGVTVTVAPFTAPDMDVGSLVLARAVDLGADLIVMGGYGHSRLREMVFGGVTYHILKNQIVPVLLAS